MQMPGLQIRRSARPRNQGNIGITYITEDNLYDLAGSKYDGMITAASPCHKFGKEDSQLFGLRELCILRRVRYLFLVTRTIDT